MGIGHIRPVIELDRAGRYPGQTVHDAGKRPLQVTRNVRENHKRRVRRPYRHHFVKNCQILTRRALERECLFAFFDKKSEKDFNSSKTVYIIISVSR